jgi:hypothetical protein
VAAWCYHHGYVESKGIETAKEAELKLRIMKEAPGDIIGRFFSLPSETLFLGYF